MTRKYVPAPIFPDRNVWGRSCGTEHRTPRMTQDGDKPVRFTMWLGRGRVKLTLWPGDKITWHSGANHEEGWGTREIQVTLDADNGRLYMADVRDGRDCDGRLTTLDMYTARPDDLNEEGLVQWNCISSRQRDYAAEAMGY